MDSFVTVLMIVVALVIVAVWGEIRERRSAPGDGDYRNSGPRS